MKKQLLLLVLMMLPLMAFAHDIEVQNGDGKTIFYNFINNGTELEVTFQGNYYLEYKDEYKGNVIIPQEVSYMNSTYKVTSVGQGAFYECTGLTSVIIPNSVTKIGVFAFWHCYSLTSVTIPNSVTSIGERAFEGCTRFSSVTMGNSVTSIGEKAFSTCTGLKKVIVSDIAAWCNIKFADSYANPLYYARHLYSDENTEIKDLIIPNNVTSIGNYVFFGCSGLTSITIPNGVTNIGNGAFAYCSALTSVAIPNGVTSIGQEVFLGCSGLSSVTISNSVTSIGENAFKDCDGLKKVIVPDIAAWCGINLGNYAANPFYYARHLYSDENTEIKDLVIPNSVTSIGDYAFFVCSGLSSVTIPNSVTNIGNCAFCYCSGLTSLTIGNSVTSIGEDAFRNCSGLTSITIPNSVTSIGNKAFEECYGLTSVTIGNGVTSIGNGAFYICSKLASVILGNSVTSIGYYAFSGCNSLISMVIPSSVVSIEEDAFNYCTSLKELIFEDGEEPLQFLTINPTDKSTPNWFKNCPLDSIYLGRNINFQFTPPGSTYSHQYSPFGGNDTLRTVSFGNKVNIIPEFIFSNCIQLNHIELSNSITNIGRSAFSGCQKLKSVTIPQNITNIGSYAFGTSGLISLIIEDSENILYIEGRNTFSGCTNIYLGRNISGAPFSNYSSFQYITIGQKVTELKGDIFYERPGINKLVVEKGDNPLVIRSSEEYNYGTHRYNTIMPFSKTPIDTIFVNRTLISKNNDDEFVNLSPFHGVPSSYELILGNDIQELGDYCFKDNNITSISIPKNLKKIGNSCFSGCAKIKTVNIEESDESLEIGDEQTFYQCSLDSMYLGRNLVYNFNKTPFPSSRERLMRLIIGNRVTEINNYMFLGFKSLQSIDLPKKLIKIGKQAFYGCEGITTLTIPSSVTEIGQQAFEKCRGLKTLTFEDSEIELALTAEPNFINNAFLMSPLEEIYLGRNINYPISSPFLAIETIKKLTLGNMVTRLSDGAFGACPNLKEVYSNAETVPTTEGYVFTESYLADATLFVPYSLYDEYRVTNPWNKFGNIHNFEGKYNLFYLVDGEEYKKYVIDFGESITPEAEPTKEGYVFSGWSEIPETMPEHDVTINGTFSALSYKLVYLVDGIEYRTYDVSYGTAITPEAAPEKEGYSFSGWSEIPETMPAHDVTVTGTFTINKYKLTYVVDNEVYKSYELDYGTTITPEAAPEKEGYTFSGWSEIPETMPACDVNITGTFTINKYKLTYMVDGEEYKSYDVEYGVNITPEQTPTKVGYTFSGWSEIPETMPAHDVTVTGSFTINQYQVTYIVDGEIFKTEYVEYASEITPPSVPEREGYSFAWNEYPETMPANDINITGQYTINSYKLSYVVDGAEYKSYDIVYNTTITPEANPTKEGYTFSGWSEIPETMPAHDVTVTGSFSINSYKLTYMIDDKVYKETMYEYGATITPEPQPEGDYATFEWTDLPEKMPAHNVVVHASYTTEIIEVLMATQRNIRIYSPNGKKLNKLQKGLNIVILDDGTVKRVVVK